MDKETLLSEIKYQVDKFKARVQNEIDTLGTCYGFDINIPLQLGYGILSSLKKQGYNASMVEISGKSCITIMIGGFKPTKRILLDKFGFNPKDSIFKDGVNLDYLIVDDHLPE